MTGPRPRGICPRCGRDIALTGRTQMIGFHHSAPGDRSAVSFNRCPGMGQPPADAPAAAAPGRETP